MQQNPEHENELADRNAEEAVVSILWDHSSCFGAVSTGKLLDGIGLLDSDFVSAPCRRAFGLIASATRRGEAVTGAIPDMENTPYRLTSVEQLGAYSNRIREAAGSRVVNFLGREAQRVAHEPEKQLSEKLEHVERILAQIPRRGTSWRDVEGHHDTVHSHLHDVRDGRITPSVPSGFADLDAETAGFPATLCVIAAMPGVGKSAFLGSVLTNMAERGDKAAVFSMEDSAEWLVFRQLAKRTRIHQFVLRNRPLSDAQFEIVGRHWGPMCAATRGRILLDDRHGLTAGEVMFAARDAVLNHGAKALFLDNMTAMRFQRGPRMDLDIQDFLVSARALATEHGVPFVVLGHIKRRDGLTETDMPRLTDCAETSAFEKLCRVGYGLCRSKENGGIKLAVLKNTNGRSHTLFNYRIDPVSALVEQEDQAALAL